jgi:hypothetical protein
MIVAATISLPQIPASGSGLQRPRGIALARATRIGINLSTGRDAEARLGASRVCSTVPRA